MEEKTIKKIVGAIIIVLVFALLLTGIGCNWTYVWGSMTGQQFYTEQQYNQNYDDAYNKGFDEGFGQYKPLIEQLSEVENLLNTSQLKVNELTENDKVKTAKIAELETSIESKNVRIKELESKGSTDEQTILTLRKEVEDLTLERNNLLSEKAELQTTIESLNAQILTLQNEVTRLTGLIASYEEMANSTYEVLFKNGDVILNAKAVKNGECLSLSAVPTYDYLSGREFVGWSIDNENIINVSEQSIIEDTTFCAVLGNYFWKNNVETKVETEVDDLNSVISIQDGIFNIFVKSKDGQRMFVLQCEDVDNNGIFEQSDLTGLKEDYKTSDSVSVFFTGSHSSIVGKFENSEITYVSVELQNYDETHYKVLVYIYTCFSDKVLLKNCSCLVTFDKWTNDLDCRQKAVKVALDFSSYNGYNAFFGDVETEFVKSFCY